MKTFIAAVFMGIGCGVLLSFSKKEEVDLTEEEIKKILEEKVPLFCGSSWVGMSARQWETLGA